jgi:Reverse transcriptase (RNA-dependent DNA polymerase)
VDEGTPQGGPLSPLLSNLVLNDLDKELERRGHRFCRYADDCNIYVRSRRAGERVMASVSRFLTRRLRLKVNEAKSAVARPEERKFLGFSISNDGSERRIAPKALATFKARPYISQIYGPMDEHGARKGGGLADQQKDVETAVTADQTADLPFRQQHRLATSALTLGAMGMGALTPAGAALWKAANVSIRIATSSRRSQRGSNDARLHTHHHRHHPPDRRRDHGAGTTHRGGAPVSELSQALQVATTEAERHAVRRH